MPIAWLPITLLVQQAATSQVETFQGGLKVEWNRKRIELNPQRIIFSGQVRATYDQTIVTCDELTLEPEGADPVGAARGNVTLIDPDGTFHAASITFRWKTGFAEVVDFEGNAHSLHLKADTIHGEPSKWKLVNVYGTPCHEERPLFAFRAKTLEVDPKVGGRASRPTLYLMGKKVLTLPSYSFRFDRKAAGMRLPSIGYDPKEGLDFSWSTSQPLSATTLAIGSIDATVRRFKGYNFEIGHSLVREGGHIVPKSTFSERFSDGYFDRVDEPDVSSSWKQKGARKLNFSVGTAVRRAFADRKTTNSYTIPIEAAVESGGTFGTFGAVFQARFQRMREEGSGYENRGILSIRTAVKPLQPNSWLTLVTEAHAETFLQKGSSFTWVSGQVGAIIEPNKSFRIGAALVKGAEFGNAHFAIDRLYSASALHVRSDLGIGPTRLSWLGKYDFDQHEWYDHEISLRQVAGCLEPFVVYRRFPSSLNFGVRLRMDDLFEAIERRFKK